jgi:tetratricopeptide (TPR) repeat protein
MEYQEFVRLVHQASHLAESSRLKEAVDAFYQLVLSDISDLDKSAICSNLANLYDRMGNTEDALDWFDKGIAYEEAYCRFETVEKKAQYLSQIGHSKEALPIYESLIKQPFISESDRERMRKIIQELLSKSMRVWE